MLFKGKSAKEEKKALKKLVSLFEDIKVQENLEEAQQKKKEEEAQLKEAEKEEKKRRKEAKKKAKLEIAARKETQERDWHEFL